MGAGRASGLGHPAGRDHRGPEILGWQAPNRRTWPCLECSTGSSTPSCVRPRPAALGPPAQPLSCAPDQRSSERSGTRGRAARAGGRTASSSPCPHLKLSLLVRIRRGEGCGGPASPRSQNRRVVASPGLDRACLAQRGRRRPRLLPIRGLADAGPTGSGPARMLRSGVTVRRISAVMPGAAAKAPRAGGRTRCIEGAGGAIQDRIPPPSVRHRCRPGEAAHRPARGRAERRRRSR